MREKQEKYPNLNKPYSKDNYYDHTKWTEETINEVLDELEEWLWEETPILNAEGEVVGYIDKGNCFYRDFLFKRKLYEDWIRYIGTKYTAISERMSHINDIQEHKLQLLAATGKHKENITKFILTNKYNWREKTENENKNDNTITWVENKKYGSDD